MITDPKERLQAFETMLADLEKQAEAEQTVMEQLKAGGKEKTDPEFDS